MQRRFILLLGAIALIAQAHATAIDRVPIVKREAPGQDAGEVQIYWNAQLLDNVGIHIVSAARRIGVTDVGFDRFSLRRDSVVSGAHHGQGLAGLTAGVLYVDGGYDMTVGGQSILLSNFALHLRAANNTEFDIVTSNGEIPFYADRVMAEPGARGQGIQVSSMDVRISRALAERIKRPEIAGWQVATARILAGGQATVSSPTVESCPQSNKWDGLPVPGHPGQVYKTDVFMRSFSVQMTGCKECSGPDGHGRIKITPTTVLRNNVNEGVQAFTVPGDPNGISKVSYGADVPWRVMFSRDCPPYKNDQHPYLIWNLYRITADGVLEQLAHSGVKHAHVAANGDCLDNPGSNHVLGRGCSDAYGTGDNDVPEMLGPRSEIIPFTGQWGRCGSIYDPQCKGKRFGFEGYDDFSYRLIIGESLFDSAVDGSATYYFEAWYVVRGDLDPYDSMAHVPISAAWLTNNHLWTIAANGEPKLGPVIDEWVGSKQSSENAVSKEVLTSNGRVRLAVRVTPLRGSRYRYDYVIMNVDFAVAKTAGREPNLRIVSSNGLRNFRIVTSGRSRITSMLFSGPDANPRGAWKGDRKKNLISWTGTSENELTWGNLFHFSFEADSPPKPATVFLGTATDVASISAMLLGPQ